MLDDTGVTAQLEEVLEFADNIGLRAQLEQRLNYLDTYAEGDERGRSRCKLYTDFAPASFGFTMEVKNADGQYTTWFSGGLIFHGPTDGSSPNFCVSLSSEPGWQIHT